MEIVCDVGTGRNSPLLRGSLVCSLVLLAAFWLGVWVQAAPQVVAPTQGEASYILVQSDPSAWLLADPATGPVTVRTRVQVKGNLESSVEEVWLAAVSSTHDQPRDLVAVAVVPRTIGWLTAWDLQLHMASEASPTFDPSPKTIQRLGTIVFEPDRLYETLLSFNTATGHLDLRVAEVGSGAVLYRGQHQAPVYSDAIRPGIGIVATSDNPLTLQVEAFESSPSYMAVGAEWALVRESERMGRTDSLRTVQGDETIGLRVRSQVGDAGELRFYLQQGEQRSRLLDFPVQAGESFIPLAAGTFPPGASQLVVEYTSDGNVWLTDVHPVTAGTIHVAFSSLQADRAKGHASASAMVRASGTLPGVRLQIVGTLSRLVWDETERTYREFDHRNLKLFDDTVDLTTTVLPLHLEFPVPADEPGLWQIRFAAQVEPRLPVSLDTENRLFSTYAPAQKVADAPFTVAILPDTQLYSDYWPEIFTRQTEWLAQHAEALNLAFVLHLGDITNSNSPEEWENAQRSMNVLDGVAPYVLSVGNHDMGTTHLADSRRTLLNSYFPLDDYANIRWLGGTFEPGRLDNSYHLFHAGGREWLVLALEFGPRDEVLAWANTVVADHPEAAVIVVTHTYTSTNGGRLTGTGGGRPISYPFARNPGETVNDGEQMWQKLVRHHANILMVVSGHIGHPDIPRQVAFGSHGNAVYELLMDYQYLPQGGEGWLVLMEFHPEEGRIYVVSYSPYLGSYREGLFEGFTNHFRMDWDLGRMVTMGLDQICSEAIYICR